MVVNPLLTDAQWIEPYGQRATEDRIKISNLVKVDDDDDVISCNITDKK